MRVVLVLASSTGGIGRHVAALVAGLAGGTDPLDVHVCGPAATEDEFGFTAAGARFTAVEIPASPQPRDAAAVRALRRAMQDGPRPAAVHAHGLRAGLVAALARPGGCPLVVTWHNRVMAGGLRAAVYGPLERYVARAADVNLGASADLVERARRLGARDARLGAVAAPVLPPPRRTAAEVRDELGAEPDQPVILSVGRLHPQKRHDLLIAAAARWCGRRPVPLVAIAGTGPAYMPLAGLVSRLHAPVHLLGQRHDVSDLLGAADLAVVCSDWEARQLFAQEALRAGVPLVATTAGGVPDLVGDAALLVPPGDLDAIDAAVQRLLDDPDERAWYARRGPVQAATWPTEADTVAHVRAVYTELVESAAEAR